MTRISALLVLLSLVAGYIFCTRLLAIRYRIRLSRGYHTFLLSAAWGVSLIGVGFIVLLMLPAYDDAARYLIALVESRLGVTPSEPTLLSLSAGTIAILIAVAMPPVLHRLLQWARDMDHVALKHWAYDAVLTELNETGTEDLPLEQFLITVPTREIVHAHLYDIALGEVFRAHEMRLHRRVQPHPLA